MYTTIYHIGIVPYHKLVPTSMLYLLYMRAHMQSHIARTQTDRVLRILRTTKRAIRQNDRAESLLSIKCSTTAPVHT